jgi:hypothetical protein
MRRIHIPQKTAQWIEENGYYLPINNGLFYDVLAGRLIALRPGTKDDWATVELKFPRKLR